MHTAVPSARTQPALLVMMASIALVAGCPWGGNDGEDAADTTPTETGRDAAADTADAPADTTALPGDTRSDSAADTTVPPADTPSDTAASDAADGMTDSALPLRPLTSNTAWARIGAGDDPLADHRPDSVECPQDATTIEKLDGTRTYTVSTADCNYLAARQPMLNGVQKGDRLRIRLWHFELTAGAPGQAHAAVLVDGKVVWEQRIPIPSQDSQLLFKEWEAQSNWQKGTEVVFHLHNHGSNTWNFIEFSKYYEP